MKAKRLKEAKNKFIKRSFICCVVAILICWFMKIVGFDLFQLDMDNKFFNDLDWVFNNYYIIKQVYCAIMLSIQLYWMTCIVQKEHGKKIWLYILCALPFTIGVRVLTSIFSSQLGNWSVLIEFAYTVLITSMFKFKKMIQAILVNILIIVYQIISLQTRSLNLKAHANGFMVTQILTIDFYLMLYLTKEVILMNDSTWFFFGFTSWIYRVAGFIVGIFTGHPIKKSREYYEKGKAKEDARKTKKETKKLAKGK